MSTIKSPLKIGQHDATNTINQTINGLKDGVAQASAGFQQAQDTMRDGMEKATKAAHEMMAFSQGNVEALSTASQIFATGIQDMFQQFAATSKASLDDAMSTVKAMGAVKSVREAMDLQSGLVRSALEKSVAQTTSMTDASMKLSERALAPITARITLASETFGRTA